jgi:hypothetical protein
LWKWKYVAHNKERDANYILDNTTSQNVLTKILKNGNVTTKKSLCWKEERSTETTLWIRTLGTSLLGISDINKTSIKYKICCSSHSVYYNQFRNNSMCPYFWPFLVVSTSMCTIFLSKKRFVRKKSEFISNLVFTLSDDDE